VPTLIGCSLLKSDSLLDRRFSEKNPRVKQTSDDFFALQRSASSEEAEL
jgi:hypothetical protein